MQLPRGGFKPAVEEAVKWIARRSGSYVPQGAFNGEPFDTGLDAHAPAVAHVLEIDGRAHWAAKLRFPDNNVPGRLWLTEIVIRDGDTPDLCVRLRLKDSEDSLKNNSAIRTVPGIVRQIIGNLEVRDGDLPVSSKVIEISNIEYFSSNIVNSQRRLPFLLFGYEAFENRRENIEKLANKLAGVSHVGALLPEASWAVTQHWTRRFSVFGNFAKLYFPILNPAYIEPLAHPLIKLEAAQFERLGSDIIGVCQKYRHPAQTELPRFLEIYARDAESSAAVSDPADQAQIENLQSIIKEQREDIENFEELLNEASEKARDQDKRLADLNERIKVFEARLALVTDFLRKMPDRTIPVEPPPLRSPDQIVEWCELAGAGYLSLSKEFLKTFEDAPDESSYLYRVGIALHGIAQLTAGLLQMNGRNVPLTQGVELSPIGDTQGFDYSFSCAGVRYVSDWHAKWGNGRDIRAAFRIYYYWDRHDKKALLHCFTTHMDNKSSN